LPEVIADALAEALRTTFTDDGGIERLEEQVRRVDFDGLDLLDRPAWRRFADEIRELYRERDHVIVRGLPVTEDGASALVAALAMGRRFRTYRGDQVVKKFRMSPWTEDLSHTTKEGDFHTDINTAPQPPALTAIQCLDPDPGAPDYGQNRVARLGDLLAYLESEGDVERVRFLRRTPVTMSNARGQAWSGTIVDDGSLRYHPATLRAATQTPDVAAELEAVIGAVHEAALAVSRPFDLGPGDVLFVSNRRALHYRGECSVRFTRFPTEYQARAIFVLHQLDEPR
jgi:alpha-ketoglutarate-dependent taurine dioxygenase